MNEMNLLKYIESLGEKTFFQAVQRGLALALPLVMVGALAISLRHFPYSGVLELLDTWFGDTWRITCETLISSSFGIASLAIVCAISGAVTALHNQRHSDNFVTPTMAVVVVLSCFFVLVNPGENDTWKVAFSMDRGLVVALLTAVIGVQIYLFLSRIRALQLPLGSTGNDPHIRDVLTVMPAGMITILLFACTRMTLVALGIEDLHGAVREIIATPFLHANDHLGIGLAYSALSQLFWFFGAHGPNLLFPVEESVFIPTAMANLAAYTHGTAPQFILTKPFFDAFTRIGGSGSTLCLILAILWKSRNSSNRKICLLALLPALCNVNEPLVYGIPLILNPIYLIPFLLTPVVQTFTAYTATLIGLVPHTIAGTTWTTPALLSGYLTTGSISGVLMQLGNITLGALIYLPFVLLAEKIQARKTRKVLDDLMRVALKCTPGEGGKKCINFPGEVGRMAKTLANDLQQALLSGEQLFLEFQPQVDALRQTIHGAEALLRWRHPYYGLISPPIAVSIAEDTGIIDQLGSFVLTEACTHRVSWMGKIPENAIISVNVSPYQLRNAKFEEQVKAILVSTGIAPQQLMLEIVESSVLEPDKSIVTMLQNLQNIGVGVAIDDFGMGHASLRYLREFPVNEIKIDRSLTEMTANDVNEHIVRSIVDLSRSIGFSTVVEGVERKDQMQHFLSLGCSTFQGYYFSRPVNGENCLAFMVSWGKAEHI